MGSWPVAKPVKDKVNPFRGDENAITDPDVVERPIVLRDAPVIPSRNARNWNVLERLLQAIFGDSLWRAQFGRVWLVSPPFGAAMRVDADFRCTRWALWAKLTSSNRADPEGGGVWPRAAL